ncbi:MAG TPA: hypothetical protein VFN04_06960, partial [Protaetiibacter sp.]|nr:hypothetical protein [Protaetiibacter sp.]
MTAPAEHLVDLAQTLNAAATVQAHHQTSVGFGREGDRLRQHVFNAQESVDYMSARVDPGDRVRQDAAADLADAEVNLRNYYLAKLALIDTEVAEAIEEIRNGHAIDERYYPHHQPGCPISDAALFPDRFEAPTCRCAPKPEGVPSELADVIIRVLSLAGEVGIPIGDVVA